MKRGVASLLLIVCVAVACVAVGCARTVPGDPRAASNRGLSGLDLLLLSDSQISTIMRTQGMTTYRTYTDIPVQPAEVYSRPECAVALFNTTVPAYEASGYVAALGKKIDVDTITSEVDQAVIAFESTSAAKVFIDKARRAWQSCAGQKVTYTRTDGQAQLWRIGAPRTIGEITAIDNHAAGGWICGHAMATKSQVVVDVDACGYDVTDEAINIVKAIITAAV
jgi:serine/threonine kinase PknH